MGGKALRFSVTVVKESDYTLGQIGKTPGVEKGGVRSREGLEAVQEETQEEGRW